MFPFRPKRRVIFALFVTAVMIAGCSKDPNKDDRLSQAAGYFSAGQFDKAEKEYREILRLDPLNALAERQLAVIYHGRGQLEEAYPLLKRAVDRDPKDLEMQMRFGAAVLARRDYAQAHEIALHALEQQPDHEEALLLLVDTAIEPDTIEETQKFLESRNEQHPGRPGYHLALGELALRKKDRAVAENEFNAALKLEPKSAMAYAGLGTVYWSRNELDAADRAFKIAVGFTPPGSPIWLRYAEFKLRTGAISEAKAIFENISRNKPDYLPSRVALMKIGCTEAQDSDCEKSVQNILAEDANNYDALFLDGMLSLSKGEAEKAIRTYAYLANGSQNPQVRYQLALAYLLYAKSASQVASQRANDAAEKLLDEAIKLDPRYEQALLLQSRLKISKGDAAAAVELLAPRINEGPQTPQWHYLLASAYLAQKKQDEALAVYRRMTELFPQDPQPLFLIGKILEPAQELEARAAFEKSLKISPYFLPSLEKLVDLDITNKQYSDALVRVQRFIDKDPTSPQPWALSGKISLAQQDFTRAERDLLKAIELDPQLEPAYLLIARVYVASNKPDEAISKLTTFVAKNQSVPALMQLGRIHQGLDHFDAAREAYESVLKINPIFSPALNQLAMLYSGRPETLEMGYGLAKKAREINPREPRTADILGWISYKKGDYSNALRLLQESAVVLPESSEVRYHLGMAQYMLGQEESAARSLQIAVDARTDFPDKESARKRLLVLAIDVGKADNNMRNWLDDYLREQPNDPIALMRFAEFKERDGTVDQAIKIYERIVSENPLFNPGTRKLALLYGQNSTDVSKAYEIAMKARQAYPDDLDIAKLLGILNYRRGFYSQSAALLKDAAAKLKDDPEIMYYLGQAYRELKQWNECKREMELSLGANLPATLKEQANAAIKLCSTEADQAKPPLIECVGGADSFGLVPSLGADNAGPQAGADCSRKPPL